MSSIATPLSTTPPSVPLLRSFFHYSPKNPLSLNNGFRQKKLIRSNKVSKINCSFHRNFDEFYDENFPSFFGELEKRQKIAAIKNPWQTLSPENTCTDDVGSFPMNLQMEALNGSGIPISLRIITMKRKLMTCGTEITPVSLHLSVVKSLSSVLLMIDRLLSLICNGDLMEDSLTVSKEMSDSLILLHTKICVQSPDLFLSILNLLADLIVLSVGDAVRNSTPDDGWCRSLFGENKWFFHRRINYYERGIVDVPNNSLILGNFARFLYQNSNDKDRAEEFFVRAVEAEPSDAEALSQYAMFLWHEKRDVDAAEEKLLAAIEADPQSCYHRSNYAWFLWKTGDSESDTCFPPLNNA